VRRAINGGPAAARNTAIRLVETDAVAMLDSDCVAPPGWIEQLAAHLADPLVALVAPRIRPRFATSAVGRYGSYRSCLDLGPAAAAVAPRTRVAYVPTAAVIARRAALLDVAVDGAVFDEALRYGEDVDLVWRLHDAGWRSRYDPSVVVAHDEPECWRALVTRRFRYGTSAAPLALRHPAHTVALVLPPWPAIAVAGLLVGRPSLSAAGATATLVAVGRTVRGAGLPADASLHSTARILGQTWTGTGRYVSQFGLLVAAGAVVAGGRRSSSWQTRLRRGAWLGLLLAPIAADRRRCPPDLDPIRGAVAQLADEAAYGAGVWAGCLRHRSLRALRPAAFRSARSPRPRGVT
jgi:mycofactocin system glycosyltransferase